MNVAKCNDWRYLTTEPQWISSLLQDHMPMEARSTALSTFVFILKDMFRQQPKHLHDAVLLSKHFKHLFYNQLTITQKYSFIGHCSLVTLINYPE